MGGGGMGDPMGGGAGAGGATPAPKAAIKVTSVWDVLRNSLGHEAERKEGKKSSPPPQGKKESPKPKSLIQ
jgi:hypothetical protein